MNDQDKAVIRALRSSGPTTIEDLAKGLGTYIGPTRASLERLEARGRVMANADQRRGEVVWTLVR